MTRVQPVDLLLSETMASFHPSSETRTVRRVAVVNRRQSKRKRERERERERERWGKEPIKNLQDMHAVGDK